MINKRQYTFLSFSLTKSLFLGGALSLLIETSKNNLLITSVLGMFLSYFLLYLFYKKRNIHRICLSLVCIISLFMMMLVNASLTSSFLLIRTPSLVIILVFFFAIWYGSNKDMKVVSRVGEIIFPLSIIIVILSSIALLYLINLYNLLPIFNTDIIDFIKGILIFTGASLLPNLVLINYADNFRFKDISKGYIIGALNILIIMFFILSIYGYEFASIIRFPEYLILKKIDIFNYVSNVENIFIMEWIINLLVSSLVCLKVLKLNISLKLFTYVCVFLVIGLLLVFINNYAFILLIKEYYYHLAFIIIIFSLVIKKEELKD